MEGIASTGSSQHVSAGAMVTVMACHDRGFYFLGGPVSESDDARSREMSDRWREFSDRWWTNQLSRGQLIMGGLPGSGLDGQIMDLDPGDSHVESAEVVVDAVRHLVELMKLGREGKMSYLCDAGMGKSELTRLVELTVTWVNDAGLDRLGSLSRFAAQWEQGPGFVLQTWMDAERRVRLALLLDGESMGESALAAAYAVSHAAELVLASYGVDLVDDGGVLSLVAGDDLD